MSIAKTRPLKPLRRPALDKYAMYQEAVQGPEAQCHFFERAFLRSYGRQPIVLREDFCGTGLLCCAWVSSRTGRKAFGCDLDPEPLTWGREHNLPALRPALQTHVRLVRQDVRQVKGPKADVISAENFSYFYFKTRAELRRYFKAARGNLANQGLLVLDIMGGSESMKEDFTERRRLKGFDYVWEQKRFDPVSHQLQCYIHFKPRHGRSMPRAFSYDWRLWTIPEVRELLLEAGFKHVDVYWENSDARGGGNGVFRHVRNAPADPGFVSYIVGVK